MALNETGRLCLKSPPYVALEVKQAVVANGLEKRNDQVTVVRLLPHR